MIAHRLAAILHGNLRVSLLILHLVWGIVLIALAFPLMRPQRRDRVIMAWSRRLLGVIGVRPRAGAMPDAPEGALLVCNHVSWLDIFLVLATRRVHFVSKAEVRAWPVAGWLARKTGTLFLARERRADTVRINAEMAALLASGAWVAVFPEGTTSDGQGVRRFLPSLLQPAVELGCPVVPAALRYRAPDGSLSGAAPYVDDMSLWTSVWRIVRQPAITAELQFGAPISSGRHRRELAAEAERAVAGLLGVSPPDRASAGTESRTRGDPPA